MKQTHILFLIFLLFMSCGLHGQKMLLLENANRVKPKKLYIGDVITYQQNDGYKTWYTARISDIDVEKQTLDVGIQTLSISEITALRRARTGLAYLGKQGLVFGAQAGFYGGIAYLLEQDKRQARNFVIGAGAVSITTWLTSLVFKYKKKKMGKKYRLRIVEVPLGLPAGT